MTNRAQTLEFKRPVGSVISPAGNAYVQGCAGPEHCVYEHHEDERAYRFEQTTGVSCTKDARQVMEWLLEDGHFDRRQLALAWRTNSLWWDSKQRRLRANVSRYEQGYGIVLMVMGAVFAIAYLVGMIFGRSTLTTENVLLLSGQFVAFVSMAPFAEKFLVRPNRLAARAEPLLAAYYAGAASCEPK